MKHILIFCATLSVMILLSCESQEPEPSDPMAFKFDSLVSESYELYYSVNPATKITAYASGQELSYYWSATAGEIFGSGNQVTYSSNPGCCGGYQIIQCIVQDKNNQHDIKKVEIYVDF